MNTPATHVPGCNPDLSQDRERGAVACPACRQEEEWSAAFASLVRSTADDAVSRADGNDRAVAAILAAARSDRPLPELPSASVPVAVPGSVRSPFVRRIAWVAAAAAAVVVIAVLPRLSPRSVPDAEVLSIDPVAAVAVAPSKGEAVSPSPVLPGDSPEQVASAGSEGRSPEPAASPLRPSVPDREAGLAAHAPRRGGEPVEFRVEKADDRVRLKWTSDPEQTWRVARCPLRPSGPLCNRWVTVTGGEWLDEAPSDEGLVVYRIERVG